MTSPSFRDVEMISALLDGQLAQAEAARLQTRLKADPELASVYEQLAQSRSLLRKLPARRAPRNFTLTPQMVGLKAPTPRSFPIFRFASALASLLLVLSFAANRLGSMAAAAPVLENYGMGGGAEQVPAAEAPAMAAPSEAPAPTEAPAAPQMDTALATQEEMLTMATAPTPTLASEPTLAAKAAPPDVTGTNRFVQSTPAPVPSPSWFIPPGIQIGLLALAVLSGAAALYVRWRADQNFARRQR